MTHMMVGKVEVCMDEQVKQVRKKNTGSCWSRLRISGHLC